MRIYVLHFPNPPGFSGCSIHTIACRDYQRRDPDADTWWSRPFPFAWMGVGLVRLYTRRVERCDKCIGTDEE